MTFFLDSDTRMDIHPHTLELGDWGTIKYKTTKEIHKCVIVAIDKKMWRVYIQIYVPSTGKEHDIYWD